ncbi:MAG: NADH-quinone oxidoreductase subunit A [Candidatus Micrarchaeota archaeon]|nr:NADH-quinone oxidoreductase subunit A [Candidatus Micrarchaeota archaeon]
MLFNYIALVVFVAFAIFVPVSFLLTAKMLGRREHGNRVKNAPYEAGEQTIGSSRDIDNEYLPFFMMFLPFEIALVILMLWSVVAKQLAYTTGIEIIALAVISTVFSIVGYRFISGKNE